MMGSDPSHCESQPNLTSLICLSGILSQKKKGRKERKEVYYFQNLTILAPLVQISTCRSIGKKMSKAIDYTTQTKTISFPFKNIVEFCEDMRSQIWVVHRPEIKFPRLGCTTLSCRFHYVMIICSQRKCPHSLLGCVQCHQRGKEEGKLEVGMPQEWPGS